MVAAKMLVPVLVAAALMLQGCLMADFPWSAKIMIADKCHKTAEELNAKDEMKAIHVKSCDQMDADKLQKYDITDCETLVQNMLHFAIAVECEATVAQKVAVECGVSPFALGDDSEEEELEQDDDDSDDDDEGGEEEDEEEEEEDEGEVAPEEEEEEDEEARRLTSNETDSDSEAEKPTFDAEACKAAIGDEVSSFAPEDLEEEKMEEEEEEYQEAFLALTAQCHNVILEVIENLNGTQFLDNVCKEVTDETRMTDMGLSDEDCSEYFNQQYTDTGVVACIFATMNRDDLPGPEDITLDDIKTAAKDFGEQIGGLPTVEELQQYVAGLIEDVMGGMVQVERLRLFQTMRKGQWPGRISRGGRSSSVGALAAASVLALAALTCAAWRLRPIPQDISEGETAPILALEAEEPVA